MLTTECASRKGRTKKEASCNTNKHNPAGHERKIVQKLQNAEKKAKEWHRRGVWITLSFQINNWEENMLIEQSRLSCRLNRTAIPGNRPQVSLRETDPPQDEKSQCLVKRRVLSETPRSCVWDGPCRTSTCSEEPICLWCWMYVLNDSFDHVWCFGTTF